MIWAGEIGAVREVHAWTNRPIWPQGIPQPLPAEPVPDTLDWDVWLGPARTRVYNSGYAPFKWRGWYDFGCGALGDMACHILDPANWALRSQTGGPRRKFSGWNQRIPLHRRKRFHHNRSYWRKHASIAG
jgi:predicted dehydrogenase